MRVAQRFELPLDRERDHHKAVRLEWITIAYLVTAIVAVYLTLGGSQAMRAAVLEDLLSLLPPAAFLAADRARKHDPDERFPWGRHRAVSIAYLAAALALFLMGAAILFDSVFKLVAAERPPIPTATLFGEEIWLGWLMLAALFYSALPAVLLGRAKLPLAASLHDKVLYADAKMNKADWLTAAAAGVGVLGIGLGYWWADAVAAIVISLDILHDGQTNVRTAVYDLLDRRPLRYDGSAVHPLPARVETELEKLDWVDAARVRLREEGHVFVGEADVVPGDARDLVRRIDEARQAMLALDWRLHELAITPVRSLAEQPEVSGKGPDGA